MTTRLASQLSRLRHQLRRRTRRRFGAPAQTTLKRDITHLEPMILLSASPLADLLNNDLDNLDPDALPEQLEMAADDSNSDAFLSDGESVAEETSSMTPPLLEVDQPLDLSGRVGSQLELTHQSNWEVREGTILTRFSADEVCGRYTVFSKDFSGNREGGDVSAFVHDGRLEVRFQSATESVWLKSRAGSIEADQTHQLALTFGDEGLQLYLDGRLVDAETGFTEGLQHNSQNLVIGANTWARSERNASWMHDHFDGRIEDFALYGSQFEAETIAAMSGRAPERPLDNPTVIGDVLFGTDAGETLRAADYGVTVVQAGYGDDTVHGTSGNDTLQGGHGEDTLLGGDGDDLLVSYADAREPVIAQDYNAEDDPQGEINAATRTIYPDQPIEADDVLVGGAGADTFYFRTLINAKRDIILRHVNDDGTINWGMNGVAGENDNVHDHWVDGIGHEVIWDFSRAEGDRILIEGHTTEVYRVEHQDSDGDQILDSTVLHLWSNQGNGGGAHNKDLLGTITVFGDLVTQSDFDVNKHDYGIVASIDQLDEAITPRVSEPYSGNDPPPMPTPDDGDHIEGTVLAMSEPHYFSGQRGEHLEISHDPAFELAEGTISLRFAVQDVEGRKTLFSKDFTGNRDGGDITAFVRDGRIEVRFQNAEESIWLKTQYGSVSADQDHHLTLTFGDDGAWLYLDGQMKDWETDFTDGLQHNTQNLAIGANTWARTADRPYKTWDYFEGQISDFRIYDTQFDYQTVATMAGHAPEPPLTEPTVRDGVLYGTDADETLRAADFGVTVVHAGYGDDTVHGTRGNDTLRGGHGEDTLLGGDGDDLLVSYADAREPVIAQNYNAEDDPQGEINAATRTIYPDQPIEADDVLVGGAGADTFYFRTLINAKRDIILRHVNDDGTINWGMNGVAGENDNVHDHWVDGIGHEVIWDFSRAEGDRILIEGHTTEVYRVEHQDSDGDQILDSTVLHLWSNQGNGGGAHNKDLLGTITVFGDLVTQSDFDVNKHDYGIVASIDQLDEAITPRVSEPYSGNDPPPMPEVQDGELPAHGVFGVNGQLDFSGESGDHIEVAHTAQMELPEGTIAFSFTADQVAERQALFSKDFSGNRDGGDLTAFVRDGRLEVRFQNAEESIWLKTASGSIQSGQEYHFAMTFGDDGAWLYLDGQMKDWETDFTDGLQHNTQNLAIGANTWARTADRPYKTWDYFEGQISDFRIYDTQFDYQTVATMAGHAPEPPLAEPTVRDGVLYGTDAGETLRAADYGVTVVQAGYGDDTVHGTSGNDTLQGGHGEDTLLGGDGDDLLVSYADAREPVIAQDYNAEDDPQGEINAATRTIYPDQPIEADDVLVGGAGADTFYFRTLINAKRDIILRHVNDDGTINWGMNGVAGENDNVHDHWVDGIGHEVIWDFNRAEGDRILIEGHTTEVYRVEHQDSDGDQILDSTVLHLWSNQGNGGGAHNKDLLGTITVFGDLVTQSDFDVNKHDYGIVATIDQLDEAITPRVSEPYSGNDPPPMPEVQDGELPAHGVFGVNGQLDFSGESGDHIEVAHTAQMELPEGTIAFSFTADQVAERQALFSKDFSGNRDGGDLTAFVRDGRLEVRFQNAEESIWLKTASGSIQSGQEYHFAMTFGDDGAWLYLDGQMKDWETDFTDGLQHNTQNLAIGANTWARTADRPYKTWDYFEGQISDFRIYDTQFDYQTVATMAGHAPEPPLTEPTVRDGVLYGTDAGETLRAADYGVTVVHAGYGDDTVHGTRGNDTLRGGHGEDTLLGGDGDDLLVSYADAREPVIAQNYNAEDDPQGEINAATRTIYPDQPIEADDVLVGGAGADTFYFRTLINAKRDIILRHVNDDGTINWGMNGVAGENDNVHDHWVDGIGHEVIWDFSRAEGDRILIEGHTTEVYRVEHQDSDGDQILDSTVLHLWSNQGNGGGAHNKDLLGTITVFGDLVTQSDFDVNKHDYGIVATIDQLDEAITPRVSEPYSGNDPPPMPEVQDGELPAHGVFGVNGQLDFSGESGDHIEVAHTAQMELPEGTIAFSFTADQVAERQALFSKDFSGNRDGGDLTAFVRDGRLEVRFQNAEESIWLKTASGTIQSGQEYHFAMTFGDDGAWLYLDGQMKDWETDFTDGLQHNTQNLAIGANTWSRTADRPYKTWDYFEGQISDFRIYDTQFDYQTVATMAGHAPEPPLAEPTVRDGVLYGTDADETLRAADFGVTVVHAGYGDDTVHGTRGNDTLQGGHGEDTLLGGDGDDLLVSYADAREPVIAQNYNAEDDPQGEINAATRTIYPDQPIEADDVLVGGAGADTFYFRTLINAKRDIILRHVNDDGTINWGMNGVAGENDNVHDHWVDGIGHEVIWDFNRAEGDRILIEGHTTEVYRVEHQDSDGDQILDSTVLHLWSNQGNGGGAHNKDLLGTITVFGDLVTQSDFDVNKHDYGIVATIDQLDEAITPRVSEPYSGNDPPPMPEVQDGELPAHGVFGVNGQLDFSGESGDHIEVAHTAQMELPEGTIAFSFTADQVAGRQALFSKDFSGNRDGGDLTAFVRDGRLEVRFQNAEESIWLKTASGTIQSGQEYHFAMTFGDDGAVLYLDGQLVGWNANFTDGLEQNTQNLAIGASTWSRTETHPYKTSDPFMGSIEGFAIYNLQFDSTEISQLAGGASVESPFLASSRDFLEPALI